MSSVIEADLSVDLEIAGRPTVHARLHGRANRLLLEVDDPGAFAGTRDAPVVRALAESLAGAGRGDPGGEPRSAPRLARRRQRAVVAAAGHRVATDPARQRPRRAHLGPLPVPQHRGGAPGRIDAAADDAVAAGAHLRPARAGGAITTTHDPARGGSPRLVLAKEAVWAGERQPVFPLQERTTIGSDARLRHPPARTRARSTPSSSTTSATSTSSPRSAAPTRVHGAFVDRQLLRTGARIEVGGHCLVFHREEYADHGRPYGGRIGGEAGHQIPQPPREAL